MKRLLGKMWQADLRPRDTFNQQTLTRIGITTDKTLRLLRAGYIGTARRQSEVGTYYQLTKAGVDYLFN